MKKYLFDFDGTLVDSMDTYAGVMIRILDENGISYGSDLIKIITPLGYIGTAEYYIKELGLKVPFDDVVSLMGKYAIHEYENNVEAKNNVVQTLRELKARGASLNVLTASPHITLDPCLKRIGIYDIFDNVWSCNDFDTTKSDPEIYRMAAEKLECSVDDVIFFDDNLGADQTAKSAGMTVVGVYDKSSDEYTDAIKAVADAYITDFSEILKLDF